jgi:hypothetical protein
MKITTRELRAMCTLLVDYLERRGYDTIDFAPEDTYYQKIWHFDRSLEDTPPITLGILDDDIIDLRKALDECLPIAYNFEQLGALLTIIGATLVGVKKQT